VNGWLLLFWGLYIALLCIVGQGLLWLFGVTS
jgi:hypothetical protein